MANLRFIRVSVKPPTPIQKSTNIVQGGEMLSVSLFVYGSLSEGMVHFGKIKNFVTSCVPAVAMGSVYRLQVGYPVMIRQGNDPIQGFLVELSASDLLIALLDEFYGVNRMDPSKSLHFRETVQVLADGQSHSIEAQVYVLNPAKLPKTAVKIEKGDWIESLKNKPALTDVLTERQKSYILKLGATSGRDIIPIDLGMYRELMNLEMIVDKGRRLALSKLGVEVYRHLQ